MKKIQKIQLVSIQGVIAQLTPVGLAPEKVKALMHLHKRVKRELEELESDRVELAKRYEIGVIESENRYDEKSAHYAEYLAAWNALASEEVDLADFCILTEEEADTAVAGLRMPIAVLNEVAELLTKEEKAEEPADKEKQPVTEAIAE